MTFLNVKNRASSTLATDITATDTSLTVATGEGDKFPTSNFHITIDDEILLCTTRTGDTFTVERAKEETTAAPHSAGAKVELRITARIIQELQENKIDIPPDSTQGDILIRGATGWERLPAGTAGQFLKTQGAGANPVWDVAIPEKYYQISSDVYHSHDAELYTLSTTYVLMKEITLESDWPTNTYRVYYESKEDVDSDYAYTRIYKNGVPYGTERVTNSTTYVSWTEDLVFTGGDRIQIYGRTTDRLIGAFVRNFRILGSPYPIKYRASNTY